METKNSKYLKILLWAYKKQETGFFEEDLLTEFSLQKKEEREWYARTFKQGQPGDRLIEFFLGTEEHKCFITAKGISAVIEYLNLEEAKKSSKRAEKIALIAIGIGIIVGIAQIIISLL